MRLLVCVSAAATITFLWAHASIAQQPDRVSPFGYLKLERPERILSGHQSWEEDQFPHTLSVVELSRGGYRYWGWYGLNYGGGIGLAHSNELVHWIKYDKNPLLDNARWPSVLAEASLLYVAYTRDYDTSTSHIVLASTTNGTDLDLIKILVYPVRNQRNQNPNLFRDPKTGRIYLTWFRGSEDPGHEYWEIVSRNAAQVEDLDDAPDKVLLQSKDTLAAPTLLYLEGVYYLSTEIRPGKLEWQTKVFASNAPDSEFLPVPGNPVLAGGRACLFQYVFHNRFYGFTCHEVAPEHWVLEVVQAPLERATRWGRQ